MITAAEARKLTEDYDDGILTVLEEKIKNAASKGSRSIGVDFSVGKYVDKLKQAGFGVKAWNDMKGESGGYLISW